MKTLKNYKDFSENRLNENFLKDTWKKITTFFKEKYKELGWLYYALFLKKNDKLPKEKVEIFIPSSLKLKNVDLATESLIIEDVVSLDHPDPNIRNVGVEDLVKKIRRIFDMNIRRVKDGKPRKKNHALFIWGAPGIGKTEILNQVAEQNDAVVIEWHLSQIEPTDFRGIPKIENPKNTGNPEDERTVVKLPELFPDSDTKQPGIMFFDEMNRAPSMVLSAALSLCLTGKIGSYTLPEKWIVVAAGNRAIDLGDATPTTIEPALANRFSHVNYSPSLEDWIKWAYRQENMNPDIINFVKFKPQYFHKLDPDIEPQAWASPRSWELASEEDYAARGYDWSKPLSSVEITQIYTDSVGAEAATAFDGYLELKKFYNEKDVENVYKVGKNAKPLPKRADQAYAASASIASYKKGKKLTEKELLNLLEYTLNLKDIETRTPILSQFKDFHPEVKTDEPWKTIWWEHIKKWYKELKEME